MGQCFWMFDMFSLLALSLRSCSQHSGWCPPFSFAHDQYSYSSSSDLPFVTRWIRRLMYFHHVGSCFCSWSVSKSHLVSLLRRLMSEHCIYCLRFAHHLSPFEFLAASITLSASNCSIFGLDFQQGLCCSPSPIFAPARQHLFKRDRCLFGCCIQIPVMISSYLLESRLGLRGSCSMSSETFNLNLNLNAYSSASFVSGRN